MLTTTMWEKCPPPLAPSKKVPLAVPSTFASKLVVDRPIGKRRPLFVWSAVPLSPRILPSPKPSISGSVAKHLSTRLPTSTFCKGTKFDDADARVMLAYVLSLRGGRGGALGRRDGGEWLPVLIMQFGSQHWSQTTNVPYVMARISAKKYGRHTLLW